jgi:hypothetical protein
MINWGFIIDLFKYVIAGCYIIRYFLIQIIVKVLLRDVEVIT